MSKVNAIRVATEFASSLRDVCDNGDDDIYENILADESSGSLAWESVVSACLKNVKVHTLRRLRLMSEPFVGLRSRGSKEAVRPSKSGDR